MKEVKSPKKPLIYYYCIVLLVLMVFNSFIVPLIARQQIKEVDYGTFMSRTEKGRDRQGGDRKQPDPFHR